MYGIFLVPDNKTKKFINIWKDKVNDIDSEAFYLSHPVHSTLFLFKSAKENINSIIKSIDYVKRDFNLKDWFVFENDIAANGNDTLVIKIEKTSDLSDLQLSIVKKVSPYKIGKISYQNRWTGAFLKSYNKCGYPFVGDHWVPHLTIASINKNKKHLINAAKKAPISINKKCEFKLALFKINNDEHNCLHIW